MRVLWTQAEPSYQGELVKFPAVRCDPKPIQKPGPPILLGARGPKALERVVPTYDGWAPMVGSPATFKRDVDAAQARRERGRNPESLNISAFVSPGEDGVALEEVRYREAGRDEGVEMQARGIAPTFPYKLSAVRQRRL